MHIAHVLKMH